MNELKGKSGTIMSRLYELFYELRSEMNEKSGNFFSEKKIATQAFEDIESINNEVYVSDLLDRLYLDDYKEILDEIASLSRVFLRELVITRKGNFVRKELANLLKAINDEIYLVGFKVKSEDEFVEILYSNGYTKEIIVTGDSLSVLCWDVLANI